MPRYSPEPQTASKLGPYPLDFADLKTYPQPDVPGQGIPVIAVRYPFNDGAQRVCISSKLSAVQRLDS